MATISRSTPGPRTMRVINRFVTVAVRSGRGAIAKRLMVLHWTGKKTGKQYSTPVSRLEYQGTLFTKTRANYKHNFVDGAPLEIVLDGERAPFIGTTIEDPRIVGTRMRAVLDELGPKRGPRALGLKIEGDPTIAELTDFASADGLVVLEFEAV